jgi:hypothetical protein
MNKREQYFQKISGFKRRFRELSSDIIHDRLLYGSLTKEAQIAYREVLEERGDELYRPEEPKQLVTNEETQP